MLFVAAARTSSMNPHCGFADARASLHAHLVGKRKIESAEQSSPIPGDSFRLNRVGGEFRRLRKTEQEQFIRAHRTTLSASITTGLNRGRAVGCKGNSVEPPPIHGPFRHLNDC